MRSQKVQLKLLESNLEEGFSFGPNSLPKSFSFLQLLKCWHDTFLLIVKERRPLSIVVVVPVGLI